MNKLKIYREYIILAVIAALLLVYIIFRSSGNINYKLPEFDILDEDSITRITITGPSVDFDFSRTNGNWFIEPEGWPAESSNLKSMAKSLAEPIIADLISTSGNPELYELGDDQKILVQAWIGNEVVRKIYVGKVSSTQIYTYTMFEGDDNIYSIRGNLPSRISDKNSMRDKRFIKLNRESVLRMSLESDKIDTRFLFKNKEDIWGSKIYETDDAEIKSVVNMLSPLRCKSYLYETPEGEPKWTVKFLTEAEGEIALEIWPEKDDGTYPARCSQNGYFVNMTSYSVEKILKAFGITQDEELPGQNTTVKPPSTQLPPTQVSPVQEPPEQEPQAQESSAQKAPAQESSAQETPAQETRVEVPSEETPSAQKAPEQTPSDAVPPEQTPSDATPEQETTTQEEPAQEIPVQEAPAQETADEVPQKESPSAKEAPEQENT